MSAYSFRNRLKDRPFLASIAVSLAIFLILRTPESYFALFLPVFVGIIRIFFPVTKKRIEAGHIDKDLLFLITHLHAVSTGRPARKRLFNLESVAGGYGEYESFLRKIGVLAVDWSYGFVRAIRLVARTIKQSIFRDFLIRFSEILRTGEDPEKFLDTEARVLRRNYQNGYYRLMDILRMVLGLYTTLMSSASFIVVVMAIMMLFMGANIGMYVLAIFMTTFLIAMFTVILYLLVPAEPLTPTNTDIEHGFYKKYKIFSAIALAVSLVLGYYMFHTFGRLEASFALASLPLMIPGLYASRFEKQIKKLESFYPIFIRSFGMIFAILPQQSKALRSVLMSEFGSLTIPLRRVYARLVNGVSPKVAWRFFIRDTWSYLIWRSTNVMIDTIDAGGDTRSVGMILSDMFYRLMDLRNFRERTARTFEVAVYMLQILVVAISMAMISIISIFSRYLSALTNITGIPGMAASLAFPLFVTPVDINLLSNITMVFLATLTVLNSIAIRIAYGGMKETFWVQLSLMLFITSATAAAMKVLIDYITSTILAIPIIPTTT